MSQNRVNIIRLTNDEKRLIDYIRLIGQERITSEMRHILRDVKIPLYLNNIVKILETDNFRSMDRLIEDGFIKNEEVDLLINAIIQNKSIIIIGQTGVGKTTLLEALLEHYMGENITILERYKSFEISKNVEENNSVVIKNRESLEISDVMCSDKQDLLIFDETATLDYKIGLLTALTLGSKVLAAIHGNENWKDSWMQLFSRNVKMKEYMTSIINSSNVVFVYIGQDSQRKRKVLNITEY